MQSDGPIQPFIARIKSALHKVANHCNQLVEAIALRCHFRLMAGRNQHVFVLFDLKYEFFLHKA